ncbi:MAG: nucleotidyltransferase family protein [Ruminococcus sp.]|nr:nucleotidyltransferase family protein [Ruminococcus sp.]
MKNLSDNFIYGIYTCRLLSSVLNDTEPAAMPEGMTLEGLYEYQKGQDVSNMAYIALKKLGYTDEQLGEFKEDYKLNVLREARFELGGQQVFEELEKAEIPFLPLKGAILKNYYPNPALRTFTDIDIYVGDRFYDAEKILFKLGYEKTGFDEHNDVGYTKKPSLHIELHKDLFPDDYDFEGYFDEPYQHTELKDGYKYYHVYKTDDFFIHVLCHLYKHFTFGGCGLRQYLDIYVMTQKMKLNMDYIRSELKSFGMDGFLDTTLKLNRFFYDGEKPDDELIEIAEFVFNNSTFGNADNRLVLDYDKGHGEKRTLWGNIKYFMERWGLNYSQMKLKYKVLKYLPFLLPFCWIYRLLTALLFRRNVIKASVDDVGKMNSEFSDYVNHIMKISKAKVTKD